MVLERLNNNMHNDFDYIFSLMQNDDIAGLKECAEIIDGFPAGNDEFVDRQWIVNAIDAGSKATVEWMLEFKIDLNYIDDEGYSAVHAAIESGEIEILELLLKSGANPNIGMDNSYVCVNGWSPAHMAAAHNEVKALDLLKENGADFTLRTPIDDYTTPYEEAVLLQKTKSIKWFERNKLAK